MAKGYWVASVDVKDPERYKQYLKDNAAAFRKYGARFLSRGGDQEVVEGGLGGRIAVIEFADVATASACYHSPEYATAKPAQDRLGGLRHRHHRGLRRSAADRLNRADETPAVVTPAKLQPAPCRYAVHRHARSQCRAACIPLSSALHRPS
jgi:uncharacterized protein (DUF1330 family)